MQIRIRKLVIPAVLVAAVCALAGRAMAASISAVEGYLALTVSSTVNTPATIDDSNGNGNQLGFPTITAILNQPGVTAGHTYTSWTFLGQRRYRLD